MLLEHFESWQLHRLKILLFAREPNDTLALELHSFIKHAIIPLF
jgi:hypothetical protein